MSNSKSISNVRTSTPSQTLTENARTEAVITDAKGRSIKLKQPNVLAQYQLVEVLGAVAGNSHYMAMATPLTYVAAIDGELIARPKTKREFEALVQQLDNEGLLAVLEGIQANFGSPSAADQDQELKNS